MTLLDERPGHLIRRCHQITTSIFYEECSALEITPMQFSILVVLNDKSGVDQTALGAFASLDKATVGEIVKRLEKKGLLSRTRHKADRRSFTVQLTKEGTELVNVMKPNLDRVHQRLMEPLDDDERLPFIRMLRKIVGGLSETSRVKTLGHPAL